MKRCFRCNRILPLFMFEKTMVPHLLKTCDRKLSCRVCNFLYAMRYCMDSLDENIALKKRVKELEK